MRHKPLWLFLLSVIFTQSGAAGELIKGSQFHLRLGSLSASYWLSNSEEKTFTPTANSYAQNFSHSVSNTLDIEYEGFLSTRSSVLGKMIFAYDSNAALMFYAYGGIGKRYYLGSSGMAFDKVGEVGRISAIPTWRFFLGGDFGLSRIAVGTFARTLQMSSDMIDLGAHGGAIYQLSRAVGIEVYLGYNRGFGFSSVAVNASVTKMFLGLSYFL